MPRYLGLTVVTALALTLASPLAAQSAPPAPASAPAEAEDVDATKSDAADDAPALAVQETVDVTDLIPTDATIATRVPLSLAWTPAMVGVVSSSLIDQQGGQTLSDALENLSGLNIQAQSGTSDYFLLRGFDSVSSGLVLTDGVPEPEASHYHLYNVDRVEVLKGPAAFLYGGNPLAGAVSLVHKVPADDRRVAAEVGAGSWGALRAMVDVNLGDVTESSRFRLNGLWDEGDGYRDDKEHQSWALNPVWDWSPSEATTVRVDGEWVDNEHSPDAGIPLVMDFFSPALTRSVAPVDRTTSYQSPYDESAQELGRARVEVQHAFSDSLTLRSKTYMTRLDWQSAGTLINGVLPTGLTSMGVIRTLVDLDDVQDFMGEQLELLATASTGSIDHQLVVGVELARQEDQFDLGVALLPMMDLMNPVETAEGPPFFIPFLGATGDARSDIIAPYVLDRVFLHPQVEVLVGARWDFLDYEDRVSSFSQSDDHLSPILGIVWAPAGNWSIYGNASEGFAPPSTLVQVDRDFEESQGLEVGVKHIVADGKLVATLAAYELERENIGIPDENGITQQSGDQRSRGVELELAATPWSGGHVRFSYAYNDAELVRFAQRVQVGLQPPAFLTLDRSGNDPAFAPEQIADLWASTRLPAGFGIAAGLRYVGEQFIAEDNAFAIEDALTVDATVSWDVARWRLALHLRNLTDEETFVRGFGDTSVIPADPFSVSGSVRFQL